MAAWNAHHHTDPAYFKTLNPFYCLIYYRIVGAPIYFRTPYSRPGREVRRYDAQQNTLNHALTLAITGLLVLLLYQLERYHQHRNCLKAAHAQNLLMFYIHNDAITENRKISGNARQSGQLCGSLLWDSPVHLRSVISLSRVPSTIINVLR
jgi:hypothetical protein